MRYQDTWQFAKNIAQLLGAFGSLGMFHGPKSLKMARRRPTGRELRNPDCPFQAERIAKAAEKRRWRAKLATQNGMKSYLSNSAHCENGNPQGGTPSRLHPFNFTR